ncbi:MAG TPA: response regulator transcription factor [Candidatus Atribacteria bacterium]|nr:response regulator transcription factor [Candidatus Atribacteria bacterium]HPZ39592.1 response regulator transcription factor [Candidatus Atribacteria bacterium]
MKIRVALIDDHPIFIAGLKQLLESDGRYEVKAVAQSGEEARKSIDFNEVDVALVDVNMPGGSGIELIRFIKRQKEDCRVIMLTVEEDEESINRAMKEGAQGYILKQESPEHLLKAIQASMDGEILLSNHVYTRMVDRIRKTSPLDKEQSILYNKLTEREIEVTRLIVQGKNNKQIAQELYISESTVKNHISNIMDKLSIKSRTELVTIAVREGIQ